jgi:hypothetical protein
MAINNRESVGCHNCEMKLETMVYLQPEAAKIETHTHQPYFFFCGEPYIKVMVPQISFLEK